MRVLVFPADHYGCGHHRVIWPAEVLRAAGHDVTVIEQESRKLLLRIDDRDDRVVNVDIPEGTDVVVLQRVTHKYMAQAVRALRGQGVTVVIDVDDDLGTIHPDNPAWRMLHPRNQGEHSWRNLDDACRHASLVTATTPALVKRYAAHGRGRVLPNYLAAHYYDVRHVDSSVIGWPASLGSHPNDPDVVGSSVARLVHEGARLHVTSTSPGVGKAFGLPSDDYVTQLRVAVELLDWPRVLAEHIGVGITPLADTVFNASKSWLKPLELAAVGVPWVASPRTEYRRLHELGCGLLAERPNDWYRTIKSLRENAARRSELSEAGRAVAATLRIEDHAWKWWESWSDAVAADRRRVNSEVNA